MTDPATDPNEVVTAYQGSTPAEWGLNVTGVRTQLTSEAIALTLDACGGPDGDDLDTELIEGLIERDVPATLFLNSRWIDANPQLAEELAANPLFELANHGTAHRPLSVTGESAYGISGTASVAQAVAEVWSNHQHLTELTGEPPRWFRSGTAHYDEIAVRIVQELGEEVVGFTVNGDAGATLSTEEVRSAVAAAEPGAVVIAHMNQPGGQTAEGLLAAVDRLQAAGIEFAHLDDLDTGQR